MDILPSILVKTKEELAEKVRQLEPHFERAHLDIADGIFVPNTTIDTLGELETSLDFRVHLMVSKPENHLVKWADVATSITFHVEATQKHQEVIDMIECEVGIALNPKTEWKTIEPWVNLVDFVHFMTVEPGFYGGMFLPEVVEKIKDFHFYYPDMQIVADGGISPENIGILEEAGVNESVIGSRIDQFHV
ncbi:MAG: ribulose-phosphate 3-epimerase [Patescibacteria group bacterium]